MNNIRFLFLVILVFLSSCHAMGELPALLDFNPVTFSVVLPKPVFVYDGNSIFYSEDGNIQNLSSSIWAGELSHMLISPDSKKAVIISKNQLIIITNTGGIIDTISPIGSIYDKNKIGESFYRDEGIQWSKDSESFYLIKDRYKDNSGSDLFSKNAVLYKYTLGNKVLSPVIENFYTSEYFFNRDCTRIYFSSSKNKAIKLECFDMKINTRSVVSDLESFGKDDVFYNFEDMAGLEFGNSKYVNSFDGKKIVREEGSAIFGDQPSTAAIGGLFSYDNYGHREKLLLAKDGFHMLYGKYYSLGLSRDYFLPGNRYFVYSLKSKQYEGELLFDMETMFYMKIPNYRFFYSITTDDICGRYKVKNIGLVVNDEGLNIRD